MAEDTLAVVVGKVVAEAVLLLLLCIAGLRSSNPSFPASRMGSPTTLSYY